jgi:hypothetical protein
MKPDEQAVLYCKATLNHFSCNPRESSGVDGANPCGNANYSFEKAAPAEVFSWGAGV